MDCREERLDLVTDQHTKDLGHGPRTVAIDFDGPIHSYVSGWTGPVPTDLPVLGAKEAILAYLRAGLNVVIYSTRAETPEGDAGIREYMRLHFPSSIHNHITVTSKKPIAVLYIDDRGFEFRGVFPTPEEVKNFRPWKQQ